MRVSRQPLWGQRRAFTANYVVIESDDWGLLRHPVSQYLSPWGPPNDWAEDRLESVDDLEALFAVLSRHIDGTGSPAVFTANFVVRATDLQRIEAAKFEAYFDSPVDELFPSSILAAYHHGMQKGVFFPQYHGRTHFSTERWLRRVRRSDPSPERELFRRGYVGGWGLIVGHEEDEYSEYTDCSATETDVERHVGTGLEDFQRIFGYRPATTIAPHYVFDETVERVWARLGIRAIQGASFQRRPDARSGFAVLHHPFATRNADGMVYLGRNARFDPRPHRRGADVADVLKQAETAFATRMPLVVDSHRINFVGPWRDESLPKLDALLDELRIRYDVRFVTTPELLHALRGVPADGYATRGRHTDPFEQAASA